MGDRRIPVRASYPEFGGFLRRFVTVVKRNQVLKKERLDGEKQAPHGGIM